MSYADWEPVTIDKRGRRAAGESKDAALARAMRTGAAVAEKRFDAASNKSGAAAGAGVSARKLEEDTEHFARTWRRGRRLHPARSGRECMCA